VTLFEAVRFVTDIFPPYLHQEMLADFIEGGHLAQYIRKMRRIYGERRRVLVESIRSELGDFLTVHGAPAGMHVSVSLPEGFNDVEICERASEQKLLLWPLSPYYAGKRPLHGFVLGFGSTAAEQIPHAVRRMRTLVRP